MKEPHVIRERVKVIYTEEELFVRLKVFIGCCLAITLMGIVFVVLYSIIFVTQPLGAISPVDSKFFELIIPIATFLTGTLSGIMLASGNKEAEMKALEAATRPPAPSSTPPSSTPVGPGPSAFNAPTRSPFGNSTTPNFGPTMPAPFTNDTASSSPVAFDAGAFTPSTTAFSGAAPVSRNGKLGPPQEEHPII